MVTGKKAVKAIGAIVVIGFISKIIGFVREMILANYYGASAAMDAYNIAFNIPGILLVGLATAVTTTFIPAFTRQSELHGKEAAFALSRKLFTGFAAVGLLITGLGIVFAPSITRILAPRFDRETLALATALSRILLTTGAFTILNGLCMGLLQAQERFVIPAMIGIPMSFTVIGLVILFAGRYGIHALAYAMALAAVVQVIFQAPAIMRTGFRFRPAIDFHDPEVRRVALLVLPVFAGTMLLQVNTVVDRIFASGLPVGSISALAYANRVNGLIVSIVAAAIATVSLPALSQAAANRDLTRLRQTMVLAVRGMNALIVPMTIGMVVLRAPLVRLLFERGAFDAEATAMTATALLYLSLGLFAYGLRDIFARAFYALQDTVTPMINSGITIAVNIALLVFLVPRYGLAGLAGATSLSGVFGGGLMLFSLRRKLGHVGAREILGSMLKITIAGLVMGLGVRYLYPMAARLVPGRGFLAQLAVLGSTALCGILIYGAMLYAVRAREIGIAQGFLRRRLPLTPETAAALEKDKSI